MRVINISFVVILIASVFVNLTICECVIVYKCFHIASAYNIALNNCFFFLIYRQNSGKEGASL